MGVMGIQCDNDIKYIDISGSNICKRALKRALETCFEREYKLSLLARIQ